MEAAIKTDKRFCIIINPCSGNGRGAKYLPKLREIVKIIGGDILISRYKGHSADLARKASKDCGIIFAAGGDDTIREVLQGIFDKRKTLGIIPLGTFNNIAAAFQLPKDPSECLLKSLYGTEQRIDVGKIENGPLFTENIGIGLDAYAWSKAPLIEPKGLDRWSQGIKLSLNSLADYKPSDYTIIIDSKKMQLKNVMQIIIANTPSYCSGIKAAPKARLNDGLLDVCIVSNINKLKFLTLSPLFCFGKHLKSEDIFYCQAKNISLYSSSKAPVRVDGMIFSELPIKVKALKQSLKVMLPDKCCKKLNQL